MDIRLLSKVWFAVALGLGMVLASIGFLNLQVPVARAGSPLTVCLAGPPTCDYNTIQAAVDAAQDGDVVKVAAGTYTGVHQRPDLYNTSTVTQVVYISKSIVLQGGYTASNWTTPDPIANPTTIDAQGQGRVIYIGGPYTDTEPPPWITPTVAGFRITGGKAQGKGWFDDYGAGVYAEWTEVVISNNEVFSNTASEHGGGIALVASNGSVTNNTLHSNQADGGGGLFLEGWALGGALSKTSSYTVSHNTIVTNTAYGGGGIRIYYHSTAVLNNNLVANNLSVGGLGGGLLIDGENDVRLDSNTIISNTAAGSSSDGGGILFAYDSVGVLINNIIADNRASDGSGLAVWDSQVKLLHTTVAHNFGEGAGISIGPGPGFDGGEILTMTNTILVSHTVGVSVASGCTATLESTLWGSGAWANALDWSGSGTINTGTVNVWGDPAFVNPSAGNYHIQETSAAKDSGLNAGVNLDIDGQQRPFAGLYDIGADEFFLLTPQAYLPIILHN